MGQSKAEALLGLDVLPFPWIVSPTGAGTVVGTHLSLHVERVVSSPQRTWPDLRARLPWAGAHDQAVLGEPARQARHEEDGHRRPCLSE